MVSTSNSSVAIILVNWNGFEDSKKCLVSLKELNYESFKVFLVDNGSENDEGKKLKSLFPEIELIQSEKNLGFTGGNNLGIKKAVDMGFSHVLLLNNDTEVDSGFLLEMMSTYGSDPSVGMVQPMIVFMKDPSTIWSAGGEWKPSFSRAITLGDRKKINSYSIDQTDLGWATGCAILISSEVITKIGLLDDQFFMYFEDVDWSIRVRNEGYRILLSPKALVFHEAGASSKKQGKEGALSPKVFYYHCRNQFYIIRRYSQGFSRVLSLAYHSLRFISWIAYFCLRGRFQKCKSTYQGINDGLFGPLKSPDPWH